ncbi:MAG: pyruvate kinase [Polyangiales bacterium]
MTSLEIEAKRLLAELASLLQAIDGEARAQSKALSAVHESHRRGAENLVHYVALRHHDLRSLQDALGELGLSSLGRSEAAVVGRLRSVIGWLELLVAGKAPTAPKGRSHDAARKELDVHAEKLFGPPRTGRRTRILATLDGSLLANPAQMKDLLAVGVDAVRINAAHDDPETWTRIADLVRAVAKDAGKDCRILVDLPGPKIRTGPIEPGPRVVRIHPTRDELGNVVEAARVRLVPETKELPAGAEDLPVDPWFLARLEPGERLELVDARGKTRSLVVEQCGPMFAIARTDRTAYVVPGCSLRRTRNGKTETRVGALRAHDGFIPLSVGDHLLVTLDGRVGKNAKPRRGGGIEPARIACAVPEALAAVARGERVVFDDGHLVGIVRERREDSLLVEITHAVKDVVKLRAEKGMNFPDTALALPALTEDDRTILPWVARHADLVGMSFTQTAEDVDNLLDALAALGAEHVAVVPKIETRLGFEHLPSILLAAMRREGVGVMIARGDLAVECGYERLAEVQEEILWLAEAAHVPVIWATEVLATLTRTGIPSRAEITDAAMGERAECVMLNKGEHLVHAVRTLDDILRRMEGHQRKKSPMLRKLTSF